MKAISNDKESDEVFEVPDPLQNEAHNCTL